MNNSDDITVLNTLIATTLDSVKGYRDAAEDSEGPNSALFRTMADERMQVASSLQDTVRELGGEPEEESSTLGAVHRGFMNLKELVVARDEKAIINEVERGEDYIKSKYQTVLDHKELGVTARAAVERAFQSVRSGHDKASALKHATT